MPFDVGGSVLTCCFTKMYKIALWKIWILEQKILFYRKRKGKFLAYISITNWLQKKDWNISFQCLFSSESSGILIIETKNQIIGFNDFCYFNTLPENASCPLLYGRKSRILFLCILVGGEITKLNLQNRLPYSQSQREMKQELEEASCIKMNHIRMLCNKLKRKKNPCRILQNKIPTKYHGEKKNIGLPSLHTPMTPWKCFLISQFFEIPFRTRVVTKILR